MMHTVRVETTAVEAARSFTLIYLSGRIDLAPLRGLLRLYGRKIRYQRIYLLWIELKLRHFRPLMTNHPFA
jgi:hypothetical protein